RDNVRRAMVDAVRRADARGRLAGIGIANQGETVVVWDRESGRPLAPAIVWQDTRTHDDMERLAGDQAATRRIRETTGLAPDAYFSASKIRWLLDHVPEARSLAAQGRLCAGTLDAWLVWDLTAGEYFVTDASTAARTLLFDIRALRYDPWLLELFAVPEAVLPSVRPSDSPLGPVKGVNAAINGTPVVAGLVDQPAALFGQGCLGPGQAKATYGTGCFVYLNTGGAPRPSAHGLLTTIAWQRAGGTTYALDGGVFAAGSVVEWLVRAGLLSDVGEADALLAAARDGADEVTCVPALTGLAAPYWDRHARASWLGLGLGSGRAELVRAALEGVACRVAQVVGAMEKDAGLSIETLRVDGGLTACQGLMQMQADLLGIRLEIAADAEATLRGICFLAARAAGVWSTDDDVERHRGPVRIVEPGPASARRRQRLARFERAVDAVRQWHARGV
ncbi:MAG TPA: FGGY family carbohydrate kinase, partial [Methylomirabilota bacterium]|nr:FGGY family carbohydrate kinase [Methylomirabilota bacterium]